MSQSTKSSLQKITIRNRKSAAGKELPFQMAIRELEARCEELRGLYDAEYNHTQTLREKLAFQSALLERAKERMSDAAVSDAWAEQWVSDFASLSETGE